MIEHKKKQLDILRKYVSSLNNVNQNNSQFEKAKRAVKEKNGQVAWSILRDRNGDEYEEIEIIEPIIVD